MEVISIWFGTGQDPFPVNHIWSCQLAWKCTGMYASCTFCSNPQISQIEHSLGSVWTWHSQPAPWIGSLASAPPHLFVCLSVLWPPGLSMFSLKASHKLICHPKARISMGLRGGAGRHCANLPPILGTGGLSVPSVLILTGMGKLVA